MNFRSGIILGALLLSQWAGVARADDAIGASAPDASAAAAASAAPPSATGPMLHGMVNDRHGHTVLSIGHHSLLPAGEHADNVVSVMGSASSAGDVSEDVVAVMGNARVTGPVGGDVVSVMGNTYIDSRVGGDVMAVMGNIELGPNADIGGDIDAVGGTVTRSATAAAHGAVEDFTSDTRGFDFGWLQNWVTNCLFKGRLLAFSPGLGWAWTLALVSLVIYALAALAMRGSVDRCVRVLEDHPGESLFAAFLTTLATPILLVLLCITVIGILAVPFVVAALLIVASFGRIVMLAWIGARLVRPAGSSAWSHPAVTVVIGGLLVTLLYAVPVIGMITFQLIGFIGMGVATYALLLGLRAKRPAATDARQATPAGAAAVSAAPASAASDIITPGVVIPGVTVPAAGAAGIYPRAGFWIRMAALFIDLMLISVIVHLVLDVHGAILLLLAAYGAVMWKLKGTTLGGMICHLHVVRLDGRELDWPTAIVRALGCFLSMIAAGLGFIWIAIDAERQGWHDKIAGTVVVRVPKGVSLV